MKVKCHMIIITRVYTPIYLKGLFELTYLSLSIVWGNLRTQLIMCS